ncbi:MAG TPA: hypothetical protein VEH06_01635 [Candidatus Bathyarchaeia archaeon]|nr:hypothetical protein [Candidatus Bathyarchaeia archaeon]
MKILSNSMNIHRTLCIIGAVSAMAVFLTSTVVTPTFAIKNFFNCMTDRANEHGKLTLDEVHTCLHKEYGVYRNIPYDVFTGGGGAS